MSLDAARSFLEEFSPTVEVEIVGLGLSADLVQGVLDENPDVPGLGTLGYVACLRKREPLAPGAKVLGFELLGEDTGHFHSWLCNDLEPELRTRLGVEVNEFGLIADERTARLAAGLVDRGAIGAEPVPWRPWLLVAY
jgi:hypothetical protein